MAWQCALGHPATTQSILTQHAAAQHAAAQHGAAQMAAAQAELLVAQPASVPLGESDRTDKLAAAAASLGRALLCPGSLFSSLGKRQVRPWDGPSATTQCGASAVKYAGSDAA